MKKTKQHNETLLDWLHVQLCFATVPCYEAVVVSRSYVFFGLVSDFLFILVFDTSAAGVQFSLSNRNTHIYHFFLMNSL